MNICPLSTRELVDKIIEFAEKFTQIKLYLYQQLFCRRVIESILLNDSATITALWARQCGKTEAIAVLPVSLAVILPILAKEFPDDERLSPFIDGFWVGVFAPVKEQAEISFTRMSDKVHSDWGEAFLADEELGIFLTTDRADTMVFNNGSMVLARTASPDTQIEGKTLHLAICEETQKLSRTKVIKEIRPMLAHTNGTMVQIGTAGEARGGFHIFIQQNLEILEQTSKAGKPVRNHFQIPYDIVIAERREAYKRDGKVMHLRYEKFVEQEKAAYGGENSPEFRMNFMCLWQETRVIAVRPGLFDAGRIHALEAGPRHHGFQVAGLDVGKTNDATVLTVMQVDYDRPIRNMYQMPGTDASEQISFQKTILDWLELMGSFEGDAGQYGNLIRYLEMTRVSVLVVDATGVGDPVFERLETLLDGVITVVPYKFGGFNKSHLYKYYLHELHAGRVKYAAGALTQQRFEYRKFRDQHLGLDKVDMGGYASYAAPEGEHDDYPDSAALAAWAEKIAQDVVMPEIEVLAPEGGGFGRQRGSSFMGQQVGAGGETTSLMRESRYLRGRR